MNSRSPLGALATIAALLACAGCRDTKPGATIPESETLAALPLTTMGTNTDSIRVEMGPEVYRLGNPAKTDLEFFGIVGAGAVFDNGSAIIIDWKTKQVVSADSNGRAALFARHGSGPGEIEFPIAVLADIGGNVGILDPALSRLTRFTLVGNIATRVDEYRATGEPARACSSGSGYVVLQKLPQVNAVISHYALDGQLKARFGPPFAAGSPFRAMIHTAGRVACDGRDARVVVATQAGELLSYELDGRFNWRKSIPDAEPPEEFGSDGEIGFRMIPEGAPRSRWLASLTVLPGGLGAVQLQEYIRGPSGSDNDVLPTRVLTKLFELASGRLVGEQDDIPVILHASEHHVLLRHRDADDQQWVSVARYHLVGAGEARSVR